jgi:ATP-dependent RNA helicase RhlE
VSSFESFGFDPRVAEGIARAGFVTPTPIQEQTIPEVLAGRDVMGLAQTGTGKTAAFVLPIVERLLKGPRGKVRALIITPTRELAEQIHGDIRLLGGKTRLRSMTIYGGVGMNPQMKKLREGVEIIVACPGRLLDHMGQGSVALSTVEVLVLDEADRMLDMGFMPDVKRILRHVPRKRQTLLFSATMPNEIRGLANDILHKPAVAQIDHSRPAKTVSHAVYPVEPHLKTRLLVSLLRNTETDSVLIFTRTRMRTKRLTEDLRKAGFSVASLEGGMPQSKRQASLEGFRRGKYRMLVATDIAARGVDVLSISHVINFDMPATPEDYTHRIGRTGRMTRTGKAFTLATQEDAQAVRDFERAMEVELVLCEVEGFDYDVPAPARQGAYPRRGNGRRPRPARGSSGAARRQGSNPPGTRRPARDRRARAEAAVR